MTKIIKKTVKIYLLVILTLIIVPFLTQKEFYPFLHFVMFAEQNLEKESFVVICNNKEFQAERIYLDKGKFEALCKKYYHSGRCVWFLDNLKAGRCTIIRVYKGDTTCCSN